MTRVGSQCHSKQTNRYWLDGLGVCILAGARDFSLQDVQTGSGSFPYSGVNKVLVGKAVRV